MKAQQFLIIAAITLGDIFAFILIIAFTIFIMYPLRTIAKVTLNFLDFIQSGIDSYVDFSNNIHHKRGYVYRPRKK